MNTVDPLLDVAAFAARLQGGGRLLGLDLGSKTIGVAISDSNWRVASAVDTVRRKKFSSGRAVEQRVAGDHVGVTFKLRVGCWANHDFSSAHAFSNVVIGFAFKVDRDSTADQCSETLTGRALEFELNRSVSEPLLSMATGDQAGYPRADVSVRIRDRFFNDQRTIGRVEFENRVDAFVVKSR